MRMWGNTGWADWKGNLERNAKPWDRRSHGTEQLLPGKGFPIHREQHGVNRQQGRLPSPRHSMERSPEKRGFPVPISFGEPSQFLVLGLSTSNPKVC